MEWLRVGLKNGVGKLLSDICSCIALQFFMVELH